MTDPTRPRTRSPLPRLPSPDTTLPGMGAAIAAPPPPQLRTLSPPPIPSAVQIADKLGDVVGVIVLGALAWHGTIGGNLAVGSILALLGVNTGLRQLGKRSTISIGLGVIGIVVGLAIPAVHPAIVEGARAIWRNHAG